MTTITERELNLAIDAPKPTRQLVRVPVSRAPRPGARSQSAAGAALRHAAFCLSETPLCHESRRWLGRRVLDRHGQPLGWVQDVVVEERSLEETIDDGDGSHAWAVQPLFAMVAVPGRFGRLDARTVFVPAAELVEQGVSLRCKRDGHHIRGILSPAHSKFASPARG
ncbi:MAG TPA: hypothetical protein VK457_24600 [Chloroflexota bacterium]|nr:hypothetical protein [Chloroflexota bacterium]